MMAGTDNYGMLREVRIFFVISFTGVTASRELLGNLLGIKYPLSGLSRVKSLTEITGKYTFETKSLLQIEAIFANRQRPETPQN